jgi:hypothetical protein
MSRGSGSSPPRSFISGRLKQSGIRKRLPRFHIRGSDTLQAATPGGSPFFANHVEATSTTTVWSLLQVALRRSRALCACVPHVTEQHNHGSRGICRLRSGRACIHLNLHVLR